MLRSEILVLPTGSVALFVEQLRVMQMFTGLRSSVHVSVSAMFFSTDTLLPYNCRLVGAVTDRSC